MTIERQEMSELLTLLAATEYISKQQGTPAPSEGSPEYKGRGTSWDYSSSTPPPDGAQVLQTQTGKQWWRAGKSSSSLKDIIDIIVQTLSQADQDRRDDITCLGIKL